MSQSHTKKHLIPVPTLPLFMIEKKKPEIFSSSSRGLSPHFTYKTDDSTAGCSSSNFDQRLFEHPVKPERRKPKTEKSLELLASVHGASREHKSHKSRRKHKNVSDESLRSVVQGQGLPEETESAAILTEEMIPAAMQLFPNEFQRLLVENSELSKKIRQFEAQIQNLGDLNTPSISSAPKISQEDLGNLLQKLSEFENGYIAIENERNHFKKIASLSSQNQRNDSNEADLIKSLQSENKDLNEDILMLKNVVFRLNVELAAYQERFRKLGVSPGKVKVEPMPPEGIQIDRFSLAPLIEAYDQMITEKQELIDNYENDLSHFAGQCKDVVDENDKLHRALEEITKKNDETTEGLSALHQDASMTLEQNDLLNSQLKENKQKLKDLHNAFQEQLSDLTSKNDDLEASYQRVRGELLSLKGSYSVLRDEHEALRADSESRVPYCVHSASVSECRRLFDELKRKYEIEQGYMTSKIDELIEEKPALEAELVTLRSDNSQLAMRVASIGKMLHKAQAKCDETQNRWISTKAAKDAVKRQLQKAIAFSSELIVDQEKLLKQLHSKQLETDTMAKMGSKLANRMGSLKTQLKDVQHGARQELDEIEKRISKQTSGVDKMKDGYRRETQRLLALLKQKEVIIEKLQVEKSKTEQDLEIVWRAARLDNVDIAKNIDKNIQRDESVSEDQF